MGGYYQQNQQVRRDQYNAEGDINYYRVRGYNQQGQQVTGPQYNAEGNQYLGDYYQHQSNVYDDHRRYGQDIRYYESNAREPASFSAMGSCAKILLSLVGIVFFFSGFALGVYGIGASFGGLPTLQLLQGVPPIVLGIVGVVLFLVSLAISMYVWIAYPEFRNQANYNNYNRYNSFNNYNG